MPTANQLDRARKLFEQHEPRDLFYRVARDLLERTLAGQSDFTLTEAVAVVLLTWNRRFYIGKDTPDFDAQHIKDIDDLLDRHGDALARYRARRIESLREDEQATIESMFDDFDRVLGPVGAAKALHVLAPRFFAIWDRSVAQAASLYLKKRRGECGVVLAMDVAHAKRLPGRRWGGGLGAGSPQAHRRVQLLPLHPRCDVTALA